MEQGRMPLVGRSAELGALTDVLAAAVDGACHMALVEGEAGIGKTRMLEELRAVADARGLRVLAGTALEFEETRPFGVVLDALDNEIRRDPPSEPVRWLRERLDDRTTTEVQLLDAIVDVLAHAASDGPLVVTLDDLHWADPSSLIVLRAAIRRLREHAIVVVGSLRPAPRSAKLQRVVDVLAAEGASLLTVPPLEQCEVAELLASTIAAEPGPALLAEVAGAHGNPFFIVELATVLSDEGVLLVTGGVADVEAHAMPPRLRTTVLRRLSFLPSETLDVLRAACLLGTSFSLRDVAIATGRDVVDITTAFLPAVDAAIVGEHDDVLSFRHDLVHEALYLDRPVAVRKALHHIAGERLAAAGAPTRKVARQLALGADIGDVDALAWLQRAMEEARLRSLGIATELARQAHALSVPGTDRHAETGVWLTSVLYWSGAIEEAAALAGALVDQLVGPPRAEMRFLLAACAEAMGGLRKAVAHLERAARDPDAHPGAHPPFLAELAFRYARLGELDAATTVANEAREAARAVGIPPVAATEMVLCQIAGARGHVDEAVTLGHEAVHLSEANWAGGEWGFPFARHTYGWALIDADRIDDAVQQLHAGRRLADVRGVAGHLPLYHGALAAAHYLAGRLEDALAEADAGLELIEDLGTRRGALLLLAVRSRVLLHTAKIEEATATADAGERELGDRDPEFGGDWVQWAHGLVRAAAGDDHASLERVRAAWQTGQPLRYFAGWRTMAPDLVRLALSQGDHALAASVAVVADEGAARAPHIATPRAAALRCRGLVENDPALLAEAVDAYRNGPRVIDLAACCEDAADALLQRCDRDPAVSLLKEALAVYENAGATRDVSRVHAQLRSNGVRVPAARRAQQPAVGWASLTHAESKVVDLVVVGLSNPAVADRLFISRRTVQAHLSHVFRKLDMTSRAQLIAEAGRRVQEERRRMR